MHLEMHRFQDMPYSQQKNHTVGTVGTVGTVSIVGRLGRANYCHFQLPTHPLTGDDNGLVVRMKMTMLVIPRHNQNAASSPKVDANKKILRARNPKLLVQKRRMLMFRDKYGIF